MKYRNRSLTLDPSPGLYSTELVVAPYSSSVYGAPAVEADDRIWYEESLQDLKGKDGRMRPCLHGKSIRTPIRGKVHLHRAPGSTMQFTMEGDRSAKVLLDFPYPPLNTISDQQWSALDIEALQHMLPSVSDNFSVVNFLIELKDFRRLFAAFAKRKNRMVTSITGSDQGGDSLLKAMGKRPLSTVSQTYLNYNFAWAPFVQDLRTMYDKALNTERRLKEIWRRAGTPQTRHFKRQLVFYDESDGELKQGTLVSQPHNDVYPPYAENSVWGWYRQYWLEPSMYRATMRYTYKVPGALDAQRKLRGYLDAFGVRLDPSIIWNAIPFTFIIDWMVDIGGFLRRFSVDNLGLETVVEDFCSSHKSETIRDYYVRHRRMVNGKPLWGKPTFIGQDHHKTYERRTVLPNLFAALSTSSISAKEATLGSALIASRKRF